MTAQNRAERERARQVALALAERRRASEAANYDSASRQRNDDARRRQQLFGAINTFISQRGGYVVSLPGASLVRFECSPTLAPSLETALRGIGYSPQRLGDGMRLDPQGVAEIVVEQGRGGVPVETVRRHAGLTPVDVFEITLR
jgi:hypothetical protein